MRRTDVNAEKYQFVYDTVVAMSLESMFSKYELLVAHKLERREVKVTRIECGEIERDQRYKVVLFVCWDAVGVTDCRE